MSSCCCSSSFCSHVNKYEGFLRRPGRFFFFFCSEGTLRREVRRAKLSVYTSSRPHYTIFFFFFFFTSSSHRSRHPLRHLRASLGGYFHSRMCWVTTGSTSSQQSGLKFNESPDAYFIVQCPLSILPYPSGSVSLLSPLIAAGDLLLCIRPSPSGT